jgi:hypothetical protein
VNPVRFGYFVALLLIAGVLGYYQVVRYGRSALGGLVAIDYCIQDFGVVYPPMKIARQFRITNTSKGSLLLHKISHSSGASSRLSKRRLDPGATAVLHLTGDTQGRKGNVRFSAFVSLNGVNRTLDLHMVGTVAETFPKRLDVGNILRGNGQGVQFTI